MLKKIEQLKPGEHFWSATRGMRGWFACEFWMNNTDSKDYVFPEPWRSDDETFRNEDQARVHAIALADSSGLDYVV